MIKVILFDLDNTLIDFMSFKRKCCEAAANAMASGMRMDRKAVLRALFALYEKYGIEYNKIFQKFMREKLGKLDYKLLARAVVAYRRVRETALAPYPGVIPTLLELKKRYKLAIISDAPPLKAWLRLATLQLDDFFDFVITAADVKAKKPSSQIFKHALKLLKIKPHEALMVGDRIERDIKGAKAAGIATCYARYGTWPPTKQKSGADFEIHSIEQLLKKI